MKTLNDIQIEEVLDTFSQNTNSDVTLQQAQRTKELFSKLMTEEVNVTKNIEEQKDFVVSILLKVNSGWSDDQVFNFHSDIRHLTYFTLVMGEDYAKVMLKALKDYGIPTSIFKGLQLNTPADLEVTLPDGRKVKVHQKFDKTEEESLELKEFYVEVDGKKIYDFQKDVNPGFIEEESDDIYDSYSPLKNLTQMENDLSKKMNILYNKKKAGKQKTYNVKKGKAKVLDNLTGSKDKYPNGVRIEVILSHTGKQIYKARDVATGRFIKYRR